MKTKHFMADGATCGHVGSRFKLKREGEHYILMHHYKPVARYFLPELAEMMLTIGAALRPTDAEKPEKSRIIIP